MKLTFEVTISRKPGLSDPEGTTTLKALHHLGYSGVERASFGRVISIDIEAKNERAARELVDQMCTKLLANPVIESYAIDLAT
ncbi:MAG: phosphoribosylformylglycinamidine synthase subunit PurS [Actinomycetota bacterium]|nr:phosphoribosylformylglycinamidine synthase subunit PurS [Actinomycetota bacterium]